MQLQVHTRHTCRKGPKVWAATWFLYMIGCRCPQGCASASTAQLALQLRVILAVCHLLFTSLPGRSGYIYIFSNVEKSWDCAKCSQRVYMDTNMRKKKTREYRRYAEPQKGNAITA
jgi:hypothetical protein